VPPQADLFTPRLRLVPVSPDLVRAFFKSKDELSRLLGASLPDGWPVDPVILEILKDRLDDPAAFAWADYIYIHRQDNAVIGDGGFKGPPDTTGRVEIGYAVLPEYRQKGLATEAARMLVQQAFACPEVGAVCADTSVNGLASMAVLRKIGMQQYGTGHNEEDDNLICWRISRGEYEHTSAKR
jgi:[ribosomal protein S5]-alanine N-acetyltransferase